MMGIPPPPFIALGTIGFDDSLVLMVLALVVFGPRRLPQIGRQIGKLMYEFRKASNDFKFQMDEEMRLSDDADRRKQEEARSRQLAAEAQEHVAAAEAADRAQADPAQAGQAQKALPAASEVVSEGYGSESSYPEGSYSYEDDESVSGRQEARGEEMELRVQPPATGQPVAAERPGSVRGEDRTAPEPASEGGDASGVVDGEGVGLETAGLSAAGEPEMAVEKETTAAVTSAVTEPANHHG